MNEIFSAFNFAKIPLIIAFVAGVIAAQQFSSLPALPLLGLAAAASGLLWFRRWRIPAIFLLGLAWALGTAGFRMQEILPKALEGHDLLVEGIVLDIPDEFDNGLRFPFRVEAVLDPRGASLPHQARLSWYGNVVPVKAGERWRLRVRLKRPHGFFNPGGMDYELWQFAQGIRAAGYVREDKENRRLADSSRFHPRTWRQSVFDRLSASMAGRELAGVVIALTIGTENAITTEQWTVLRRTGTAHLVAISGSHISLIAGLVFLAVRFAFSKLGLQRSSPQTYAAATAFLAAFLYSALANFAIPTQRALIMIFVVMAGIVAQRNVRPVSVLALALMAVVVYDPLAVMFPGFWLSYGAVGFILLAISGRLRPDGWLGELWKINWATFLGLSPVLLFFFQQVSLVSPVANLLAVPTIGLMLTPLCLAGAMLLYIVPPVGQIVLNIAETTLEWIWHLLQWLSGFSWAQWTEPSPPVWTLPLALLGTLLLLAPRGIPARWLGLVMLVPALTVRPVPPVEGHFKLTLLDVGQGLAATVQTHAHTLVFDAGPRYSASFDTGSAVVEPFLRRLGALKIDALVVSHGDNDHIGGAGPLLRGIPADQILTSVPGQFPNSPVQACGAGQSWEWDGVRFVMLSPFGTVGNENDKSCVLRVESTFGSALLTGDIEKFAEKMLKERYGASLQSEILVAPHHGSNTSSTEEFLAAVRPSYVLIPSGYLNRYNFPHPKVMQRYRAIGARTFNSATSGALSVEPGEFPPREFRRTDGKYWNEK